MKGKKILFFVFTFLILSQPLFSAKRKNNTEEDLSLFEIDRLIRQTEYDEALKQLKIYIENNPLKFDIAQQRIKRIMNARRSYSELAERLIELIKNDPGNNKEIYEITTRLEQFEKHPSDENLQFIADAKKSAEFNYFRSLFLEIQEQSAILVAQNKFTEAAAKAKEGFWLYKDSFYEDWADNSEIIQETDKILSDVDNYYALYMDSAYQKRLNDSVQAFVKAVDNGNYLESFTRFTQCESLLKPVSAYVNRFTGDVERLNQIFEKTKQINPDLTDASFIPFVTRFINGAPNVADSGIVGALKGQWRYYISVMDNAVTKDINKNGKLYTSDLGKSVFETMNTVVSSENARVRDNITTGKSLCFKVIDLDKNMYAESNIEDSGASADYLSFISERLNALCKTASLLTQETQFDDPEEIIPKIANINDITGTRASYQLKNFEVFDKYKLAGRTDWDNLTETYENYVSELFDTSNRLSLEGWITLEQYFSQQNRDLVQQVTLQSDVAQQFETGLLSPLSIKNHSEFVQNPEFAVEYLQNMLNNSMEQDGIVYYYPDVCYSVSDSASMHIKESLDKINQMEKMLLENFAKYEEFSQNAQIMQVLEKARMSFEEARSKLAEKSELIATLKEKSQQKMMNSQIARNEADYRYSEAEQAYRRDQFDIARRKLQEALSKYDEALSLQNDGELRNACDEKLMELGNRITKAENEIVVREVRSLKTQAKDAYFNGRFEDAEKLLNQAKNRWAVTNVEEDDEINSLMNYVNTAISMQVGREILPTAPLYPEMSQLLNISYRYYDEGSEYIKKGNREEGEAALDAALENLQKLQYVYPINQEASLLTLKINRLRDPKKFAGEFDQKIAAAKAMCKVRETRQEGYANLLDYQALEPNYKGLKEIIYQVEIDIGIRQKKIENTDLQKAKNLVRDGRNLYAKAGNDVDKLRAALDKINQAIKLNPDNTDALNLKDEITTKIGGNTSTVLSTEDESLYQMAVKKLQNNDIIGANAITMQLLQKKQNANSKKIRELKNKIDARL